MRSTLQIIIAVQECEPVEPEELRLALMALSGIGHFIENELDAMIDVVEDGWEPAKLRASFAKETRERMFQAMKKPPDEWLGPRFTPGTPEHAERLRMSKVIAKAAGVL